MLFTNSVAVGAFIFVENIWRKFAAFVFPHFDVVVVVTALALVNVDLVAAVVDVVKVEAFQLHNIGTQDMNF